MLFKQGLCTLVALLFLAPLFVIPSPAAADPPPFGIGNWVITGAETLTDTAVVLDGDLTISSGGSLTLRNSTVLMMSTAASPHRTRVASGGTLNVFNGSVMGAFNAGDDDTTHSDFSAEPGSRIDFRDSTFAAAGINWRYQGSGIIGGMFISTSNAYLENCTFTGNAVGVTISSGPFTVRNCNFVNCRNYGAVVYGGNVNFEDCTFARNFEGAINYLGTSTYNRCKFYDNAYGLVADGSTVSAQCCTFNRNGWGGLYAGAEMGLASPPAGSTITVTDCTFSSNRIGIKGSFFWADENGNIFPIWHRLTITNSKIMDSTEIGLLWDKLLPDGQRPGYTCLWKATNSYNGLINNSADFHGSINVDSGGSFTISRSQLKMRSYRNGENSVEVRAGGTMSVVVNSWIRAANVTYPYSFNCKSGSDFRMDESTLRDCGWDTTSSPRNAGPYFETSSVRITNSTFDFNQWGIVFDGARGPQIDCSTVRGMQTGLRLRGSTVTFVNSSLRCIAGKDASLDGASLLEAINTTLEPDNLEFVDSASRVNVSWYLTVRARWPDGRGVPGANICATGPLERLKGYITDGDGNSKWNVLKDLSVCLDGRTGFNPYTLSCGKGPLENITNITLNRSVSMMVVLEDTHAPSIAVQTPLPGSFVNATELPIRGNASDDMGVISVEVVVDGTMHLPVFETTGDGIAFLEWNITAQLSEGLHSIEALAVDLFGNTGSYVVVFSVDTVEPRIFIISPPDGYLTNVPSVSVSGMAEPGSRVFLNGAEVKLETTRFGGSVLLYEGPNIITALARDGAGNSNSSTVTVILDTLPPAIDVEYPLEGQFLNQSLVDVYGRMEQGAMVSVNGRLVALPGGGLSYRTTINLAQGENLIRIEAIDAAGNHNQTSRMVTMDILPPNLQVVYPQEGLVANCSDINLRLVTEGGANLSIGPRNYAIPGKYGERAEFNVSYVLSEGENVLVFRARDAAYNTMTVVRHVSLDSLAPPLAITAPDAGYRTRNETVYILGVTEPFARVTVQGKEATVGAQGAFSFEYQLSTGTNRITVRAEDGNGNFRETTIVVIRVTGDGPGTNTDKTPVDWLFVAFVATVTVVAVAQGWYLARRLRGGKDASLGAGEQAEGNAGRNGGGPP